MEEWRGSGGSRERRVGGGERFSKCQDRVWPARVRYEIPWVSEDGRHPGCQKMGDTQGVRRWETPRVSEDGRHPGCQLG